MRPGRAHHVSAAVDVEDDGAVTVTIGCVYPLPAQALLSHPVDPHVRGHGAARSHGGGHHTP
ncbi:Uncharacterised protein [Mycobacteroides abscessus subsp. massiliense]|nr:Uncharacterised protein [Mycobacteroides abscessus subsp. massiliense]